MPAEAIAVLASFAAIPATWTLLLTAIAWDGNRARRE